MDLKVEEDLWMGGSFIFCLWESCLSGEANEIMRERERESGWRRNEK